MSTLEIIRHRAAICGYVRDANSGAPLPGATVEIVGADARTEARADGFYCFVDLADGAYTLRATIPALSRRYGSVTVPGVAVGRDAAGRPSFDVKSNLNLAPTRLSGRVQRAGNLAPVSGAEVRLRASGSSAASNNLGQYQLSAIEAGTHTVRISAAGFVAKSQSVTLAAGQNTTVDVTLTPS